MKSLPERKEITGTKLPEFIFEEDSRRVFLEEVLRNSSSLLAITEVSSPPWRARQVRPPVVRPVRKMMSKLVFFLCYFPIKNFCI